MISVRNRLLLWLLPPLVLTALAADAVTFFKAREEIVGMLDQLLEASTAAAAGAAARRAPTEVSTDDVRSVRIWDADGRLVHHAGLPGPPVAGTAGFATIDWQGRDWRVLVIQRDGRTIQAAEPLDPWRSRANAAALEIIMPLSVGAVPLFAILIWLGVGRGLKPLTAITDALGRREAASLQPLDEAGLPREVQPLARALNDLLRRLAAALESQRRFIADAAHGLRTPLTAVQLQLENLERATTAEERAAAIEQLKAGVPRTVTLVQQLLIMARLAPEEPTRRRFGRVEMEPLVKGVLLEMHPLAERRRIDLGLAHAEAVEVNADPEAIRIMVGNLVDNALRYTPVGGVVDVRLFRDARGNVLEVTDTGPGIPPADRERVLRRFQRGNAPAVPGSGLGLAIVDEVVKQHGGAVELGEGSGGIGLRVTVRLPLASSRTETAAPPLGVA